MLDRGDYIAAIHAQRKFRKGIQEALSTVLQSTGKDFVQMKRSYGTINDHLEPYNSLIRDGDSSFIDDQFSISCSENKGISTINNNRGLNYSHKCENVSVCFYDSISSILSPGVQIFNFVEGSQRFIRINPLFVKEFFAQRVLWTLQQESQITIFFDIVFPEDKNILFNLMNIFHLEENSSLELVINEYGARRSASIASDVVYLSNGSSFKYSVCTSGASYSDRYLHISEAKDSTMDVKSFSVLDGTSYYFASDALFSCGESVLNQVSHSLCKNNSSSSFCGFVKILSDAFNSCADMKHTAFMVDDTGQFFSEPVLDVHCDDVRCTHGSSIVGFDEMFLFYCQQRGISLEEAKRFFIFSLLSCFLQDISKESIKVYIRSILEKVI